MRRMYQITFQHGDTPDSVKIEAPPVLKNYSNGFWVDHDLEYTKGSRARFWIPPGKIDLIEIVFL